MNCMLTECFLFSSMQLRGVVAERLSPSGRFLAVIRKGDTFAGRQCLFLL
jgi:hypothetical protein